MRHGSLWLFHIGLADELYVGGGATPRVAMDLFTEVLRDPQPADWATDPMESLAVLVTPHPQALEHWFEAAIGAERDADGHGNRRAHPPAPFLQFAGVGRPAGIVAVASGGLAGIPAAAGPTPAARHA